MVYGYEVCVCYIDYEKAADRVNWDKLMDILQDIGMDWRQEGMQLVYK